MKISVRNLVEFIFSSGNLDNRRTAAAKSAMLAGTKIHKKIQKQMGLDYQAEVPLQITSSYDEYELIVEGRADGIQEMGEKVLIDEIKGVYRDIYALQEPDYVHQAQAMCYAYMYAAIHPAEQFIIQVTYCNLDTEEIRRFSKEFTYLQLQKWFLDVLSEYKKWTDYLWNHQKQVKQSIQTLEFPYEYRKGQRDLAVSVYQCIRKKQTLYVQAPTGVGKTMSTIFPSVQAIGQGLGDKIFYLTAKTITRTVAREAFAILREKGLAFSTVILTAKEKLCILPECDCNPVSCVRAKGHFDRVNAAVYDLITHVSDIGREEILEFAMKYQVCPFEMGLDVSSWMDGIICDYNYVFDPNVQLKRFFAEGGSGEYLFLVDEAHNLVERAREMYSAILCKEDILAVRRIMESKSKKITNALTKANKQMLAYKRECETYCLLEQVGDLVLTLERLEDYLGEYLEEYREFEERKAVLEFYFTIRNFLDIYDRLDEYYQIYTQITPHGEFLLKLFCVNPSHNLKECMDKGNCTVFFSATLLPVNYYKEFLSGNTEDYAIYIHSPFKKEQRLLLTAKDVSTRYTRRTETEYQKMYRYIQTIALAKKGNYMVFFPSYRVMEAVYEIAMENTESPALDFLIQTSNMQEPQKEEFLQEFDKNREHSLVAFCVLGGIFSEGIDLTNERLIGTIILGVGLPQICVEREILKQYYDKQNRHGFNYAYRYPGMNKVLQAAGRVIRTSDDVGIIALLDERFKERESLALFPKEWDDYKEITYGKLQEELQKFWIEKDR